MTFKRYEARPITRLAHCITEGDVVTYYGEKFHQLRLKDGTVHRFVAHQPVKSGDFVVYLNEDNIYHCSREVFLERNIVPDDELTEEELAQ